MKTRGISTWSGSVFGILLLIGFFTVLVAGFASRNDETVRSSGANPPAEPAGGRSERSYSSATETEISEH